MFLSMYVELFCPFLSPTDVHATALGEAGVPGGRAADWTPEGPLHPHSSRWVMHNPDHSNSNPNP